jgi:hypothetical protein
MFAFSSPGNRNQYRGISLEVKCGQLDSSTVIVVPNIRVRCKTNITPLPLSLHDLLWGRVFPYHCRKISDIFALSGLETIHHQIIIVFVLSLCVIC